MQRSKFFAIIIGLFLAVGISYSACAQIYASGTWRYKLTATVDTPEGLKTGSAVHEVSNSADSLKILKFPDSRNTPEFKGEAVVVDLGKRGLLFVLLKTNPYEVFYDAFPVQGASTVEGIRYFNTLKLGTKAMLSPENYPPIAIFRNIKDPTSIVPVSWQSLDKEFGKGVHFRGIELEITDAAMTHQIDSYLPSFGKETGYWEWFKTLKFDDPRYQMSPANFK